jgi:hypothetical protein
LDLFVGGRESNLLICNALLSHLQLLVGRISVVMPPQETKIPIPRETLAQALKMSAKPRLCVISTSDVRDGEIWLGGDDKTIDRESLHNLVSSLSTMGYAADYKLVMPSVGGKFLQGGAPTLPIENRTKMVIWYSANFTPDNTLKSSRCLSQYHLIGLVVVVVLVEILLRLWF